MCLSLHVVYGCQHHSALPITQVFICCYSRESDAEKKMQRGEGKNIDGMECVSAEGTEVGEGDRWFGNHF